jgi:hypothetical protein
MIVHDPGAAATGAGAPFTSSQERIGSRRAHGRPPAFPFGTVCAFRAHVGNFTADP